MYVLSSHNTLTRTYIYKYLSKLHVIILCTLSLVQRAKCPFYLLHLSTHSRLQTVYRILVQSYIWGLANSVH
uniref:Uncharacterized protein n=1 Tax=Lepeophtheirus salmonis TaxID=72036 RepID=A0A0K2U5U5_LEPSM